MILCGQLKFADGYLYAAEKLGQFQAILAFHVQNKDMRGLLGTCKRCGAKEPGLWVQGLRIVVQHVRDNGLVGTGAAPRAVGKERDSGGFSSVFGTFAPPPR